MIRALILAGLTLAATPALAQSSNTSSNSSSNNGNVRERVVDSYCDRGRCDRTVVRRDYWDDRSQARRGWRDRRDWDRPRYHHRSKLRPVYRSYRRDRDD